MKKYQLTPAGEAFAKKLQAYAIRKLDVTKPYRSHPALKAPTPPKPPKSQIATRMKGEDMIPGKPIEKETRDALRKDYLLGASTNEELAEKYGVHPNTVYNLAQRENWGELKEMLGFDAHIHALGEKLVEVIRDMLTTPGAVTVSLDQPAAPIEGLENEEEGYEVDEDESEDEDDEGNESNGGPLKWSF